MVEEKAVTLNQLAEMIQGFQVGVQGELASLGERIQKLEERPKSPPLASSMSPAARIRAAIGAQIEDGAHRRTKDGRYPYSRARFTAGSVVKLKSESETYQRIHQKPNMPEDIYGVIQAVGPMNEKRMQFKYKVVFPGVGKDGIVEGDLELIEAS